MKAVLALLLPAFAAAFAPAQQGRASTAVAGSFDKEIGIANPTLGCWDPLGFLNGADQATFNRYRASELKHGRVAMLAFSGYCQTYFADYRFPGCESYTTGHKAVLEIGAVNLIPVLLIGGALEAIWKQKEGSFPGDFSATFFPVGFGKFARDEADEIDLRTRELNNGRAAMMGIFGLIVHEQLNDKPFIFFS